MYTESEWEGDARKRGRTKWKKEIFKGYAFNIAEYRKILWIVITSIHSGMQIGEEIESAYKALSALIVGSTICVTVIMERTRSLVFTKFACCNVCASMIIIGGVHYLNYINLWKQFS